MKILQQPALGSIGGGGGIPAAVQAVEKATCLYITGANILQLNQIGLLQATTQYAQFGRLLGETLFNFTHPQPLGKMVYYAEEFKK